MLHVTQSESPTFIMSGIRVVPRYSSSLCRGEAFYVYGKLVFCTFTVTELVWALCTVYNKFASLLVCRFYGVKTRLM